jgi:hypothetical protein
MLLDTRRPVVVPVEIDLHRGLQPVKYGDAQAGAGLQQQRILTPSRDPEDPAWAQVPESRSQAASPEAVPKCLGRRRAVGQPASIHSGV